MKGPVARVFEMFLAALRRKLIEIVVSVCLAIAKTMAQRRWWAGIDGRRSGAELHHFGQCIEIVVGLRWSI